MEHRMQSGDGLSKAGWQRVAINGAFTLDLPLP